MPRGIIKIYDRVASIGSPVFCMIIIDTLGKCRKTPQKSGAIPLHPAGRIKDIVQLSQTLMELSKVFLKVIYSHEKETEGAGALRLSLNRFLSSTFSHIQNFLHRIRT